MEHLYYTGTFNLTSQFPSAIQLWRWNLVNLVIIISNKMLKETEMCVKKFMIPKETLKKDWHIAFALQMVSLTPGFQLVLIVGWLSQKGAIFWRSPKPTKDFTDSFKLRTFRREGEVKALRCTVPATNWDVKGWAIHAVRKHLLEDNQQVLQ